MNRDRWRALMRSIGLAENDATFDALSAAYHQPHRHYHTDEHIRDCLTKFDLLREQARDPDAIELALWFHDAIYDPYRADNELKSAEWARRFLHEAGASTELGETVFRLILATRHEAAADDSDAKILLDVDLSILGADAARYVEFEQQIRREYRWVPGFLYRRKRGEILQSFLRRERIFGSDLFYRCFESQARDNLRSALQSLRH